MSKKFNQFSSLWLSKSLPVYLLIIVLIAGILLPVYFYADHLFVESELAHYNLQLENGCASLSQTVKGMNDALLFTRNSATFLPLRYQHADELDIVKLQEQQSILSNLYIQQKAVLEAGLVFSDDLVLTTNWIFYPGNSVKFYPTMFRCSTYDFRQWVSLLRSRDQHFLPEMRYFLQDRHATDAVTYTARWGANASLYVLIPSESLLDMFDSPESTVEVGLRIVDTEGTEIIRCRDEVLASSPYAISQTVPMVGLTVTLYVPEVAVSRNIEALRRMVISYILMVCFLSLVIMFLYAIFFASRSLNELSRKLPTAASAATTSFSVQGTYQILSEGITSMSQTIDSQQALMKKQLFDVALTRGYPSEEQMHTFLRLFPEFPERYRLVLFRLAQEPTDEQRHFAYEAVQRAFPACCLQWIDLNGILLVMPTDKYHRQDAALLREELTSHLNIPIQASASDVFSGIDNLHSAWQQMVIIESCLQNGAASHLLTSNDLSDKRPIMPLSVQDTGTFYTAINAADSTLANSILSRCTELLMDQENNTQLYRHTYLLLYRILRQLQMENPMSLGCIALPEYTAENRLELFASQLPVSVNEFCAALRKKRTEQNDSPDILAYLNDNLSSTDLCVDSAASHFGISSTTLQKLCQEAAGMSVASYIENQRMNRSYALLMQGKLTIAEIAQQCGYNSPNSFYKAFKRRFGVAPRNITASGEGKKSSVSGSE